MNYRLEQSVRDRLKLLPLWQRIKVRWQLHVLLSSAAREDNTVCMILNNLDCGVDLANQITAGRLKRAMDKLDVHISHVDRIINSLPSNKGENG